MNRTQLTLVLVLGLVFGGIALYLTKSRRASFQTGNPSTATRVLQDFPLNDVGEIQIKAATNEVNLARENDLWVVRERNNYPASFSQVGDLLRTAWELKPVEPVTVGASQYGRLELNPPAEGASGSGTLLEFKDASGKSVSSLLLGKQQMRESAPTAFGGGGQQPVGRYVMTRGNEPKVYLVSETFSNAEADPQSWLDKSFFRVEKIRSITLSSPTNEWKVVRETENGEFTLADAKEGEKLDPSKASSLGWALSSPSFNDVVGKDVAAETTGFADGIKATIETFEGFTYQVQIGKQTEGENYYFTMDVSANLPSDRAAAADEKPEDAERLNKEFKERQEKLAEKLKAEQRFAKWTYLVGKWTIEPFLKGRKDLLAEDKPEQPAATDSGAPSLDPTPPPFPVEP